jgi:hypothetical protein
MTPDEWLKLRMRLEADIEDQLAPELRTAGIDQFLIIGSDEAGIDNPAWDGLSSPVLADVLWEQFGGRREDSRAAFLLNVEDLHMRSKPAITTTAIHEAGHLAHDLVSKRITSALLAQGVLADEQRPAVMQLLEAWHVPTVQAHWICHCPAWCRLTIHLAERMERRGWPVEWQNLFGGRLYQVGSPDVFREAMRDELRTHRSDSLAEIVASGPHAGVATQWEQGFVAALNSPDAAAKLQATGGRTLRLEATRWDIQW